MSEFTSPLSGREVRRISKPYYPRHHQLFDDFFSLLCTSIAKSAVR